MTSSDELLQISRACDRFFAIDELVSLFLHEADTLVLINCQRVCRLWKDIIDSSRAIQETLFLAPAASKTGVVTLNPVLKSHFDPLLAWSESVPLSDGKIALRTAELKYADLERLPWARDGIDIDAPTRQAFARREASWRRMLVSQPPLSRLDWWHTWDSEERITRGFGHSYCQKIFTIGMLWDQLESRLIRECSIQMAFYPMGGFSEDDLPSLEREQRWGSHKIIDLQQPRIRVRSYQVWADEGPSFFQKFDVRHRRWDILDTFPEPRPSRIKLIHARLKDTNGTHWLHADCVHDCEDENWRWSRSDAFENVEIGGDREAGWSGGGAARRRRELRTEAEIRNWQQNEIQAQGETH